MSADVLPVEGAVEDALADIPCESHWHERHGDGPAVWVVWQFQCCPKRPRVGLVCNPCVEAFLTFPGAIRCRDCAALIDPARKAILRLEPIGRLP